MKRIFRSKIILISFIMCLLNLGFIVFNGFKVSKLLNFNILLPIMIGLLFLLALIAFLTFKKPRISIVLNVLLCLVLIASSIGVNRISSFTGSVTETKEVEVLEIVVSKDSKLTTESDLDDLTLASYIDDETGVERAREILKENNKKDVKEVRYDSMIDAYNDLLKGEIDMLVLSSFSSSFIEEEIVDYYEKVKVLFSKEYEIEDILQTEEVDITKEPFVVYLGGVDYSSNGKITGSARGDVNILLAVNPNTQKAILQVVPRDLYAYNPIKKASSKLSWSGKWGGVQSSVYSIQHELGIKINYYAKINIEGFMSLIDAIGGVDVYSHYSYNAFGHYISKGMNHINGEQALAMARERKSLPLNERSRGLQQMEIIKGIMNKLLQQPSFDYFMSTLNVIEENFMTSIPEDKFLDAFTLFVNMRETFMNLEMYSMAGDIQWHEDEIKGGQYYYFYPAEGEIEKVRDRINEVLLGE